MFKKVAIVVVLALVALFVYAGLQSPDYVITRQVTVNAPAERIFPLMNNMKLAATWGPWQEMEPDTQMTYSGPDDGVGAKTSWAGGKQLGTGSATIVESVPNSRVGIKLEYVEPMSMNQDSLYLLEASGGQTVVTWKVTGQNSLMGRVMCVFMNMDKMVGGMFEKGLSNLKAKVESTT